MRIFSTVYYNLYNNLCLTHLTNWNYKIQFLGQSNYLLGFVTPNKYSLEITINKKWPDNQNYPEEDKYESPTFVYYKEIDVMVPLVSLQTPPRMQGLWSDNNTIMSQVVVESSRGVDGKRGSNVEGSPQYYHIRGH
jgi:hypothetical protein